MRTLWGPLESLYLSTEATATNGKPLALGDSSLIGRGASILLLEQA